MRTQLAAVLGALCTAVTPAAADPVDPPPPAPVLEGLGFCSVYRAAPGTDTCTYYTSTPFGELSLYSLGAAATLSVRCTVGGGSLSSPGTTTLVLAGKCLVSLTTTTAGTAGGSLRAVLTP